MGNKAVIIDATRSPIGVKNGELVGIRPDDLAAQVVKGLMDRNQKVRPNQVEDLVMGCAFPEGPQGMLIGRSVATLAGLPNTVPGKVVNRFCGSAMDALHQVSTAIESGDIEVGIAAGVEDMFSIPGGGFAPDFHPELAEQEYYIGMGETAENLANDGNISRDAQEDFAIQSHEKALAAWEAGHYDNEVIPIDVYGEATVAKDEGPRKPNVEKIKSLNPAFVEGGSVTAATSSPFSLGAAALLVTSESFAKENGLTIRAEIVSRAVAGVDWTRMGMGPIPATNKALEKAGLTMNDIEVIELNEAFAAQYLACEKELGLDPEKCNLNGGAISIGHPLGASGSRILTHLTHELKRTGKKYGVGAACIGGGQGIAVILENVE